MILSLPPFPLLIFLFFSLLFFRVEIQLALFDSSYQHIRPQRPQKITLFAKYIFTTIPLGKKICDLRSLKSFLLQQSDLQDFTQYVMLFLIPKMKIILVILSVFFLQLPKSISRASIIFGGLDGRCYIQMSKWKKYINYF